MRNLRLRAMGGLAVLCAAGVTATASAQVQHTVVPGESLWSVAQANGISVPTLANANGLPADALLVAGTTIEIPTATGACVFDCDSPVHPHPTNETVVTETVATIASRYGVSPSLAQAIASSESGFNNAVVSSADARGVMQIIPDTWEFINDQLVAQPLDPASASANVEAGIAYLHHLYHVAGGDPTQTVGYYYQGPNRDQLLPETHDYVRTVERVRASFEK